MTDSRNFYSHGKLLLSGEYFVLDGAKAIGLPCRFGQILEVYPATSANQLDWKSIDHAGKIWFSAQFDLPGLELMQATDDKIAAVLQNILQKAQSLNSIFLSDKEGLACRTRLEFPRLWGLGSSSTLINNIAQWANINPFDLSRRTLGGSGYDIACASAKGPITYRLQGQQPVVEQAEFAPYFRDQLYFIYLGKKQNSREGIKRYKERNLGSSTWQKKISSISEEMLVAKRLEDFQSLLKSHEEIVSQALDLPMVQQRLFKDFGGVIKSLGAWGGDFILAASAQERPAIKNYFQQKGYATILNYVEMVR